jgi:hypothetical protein
MQSMAAIVAASAIILVIGSPIDPDTSMITNSAADDGALLTSVPRSR